MNAEISKPLALALATGFAALAQAQSLTPMPQAELEAEFKRNVRYEYRSSGSTGKIEHAADGRAWVTGTTMRGAALNDSGTYSVKDGALCHIWKTIRNGDETCFKFARRDGFVVSLDANGKEDGSRKEIK